MFAAVRVDAVQPLQVHILQLNVLCECLEDTVHGSEGNAAAEQKQYTLETASWFDGQPHG